MDLEYQVCSADKRNFTCLEICSVDDHELTTRLGFPLAITILSKFFNLLEADYCLTNRSLHRISQCIGTVMFQTQIESITHIMFRMAALIVA